MAGGLFELRKDDITGWWVAVVVDREFNRARFAGEAAPVRNVTGRCQNCSVAEDHTRLRTLKPQAFTVTGSELERRRREEDKGSADEDLRMGLLGDVGSWETIVAPLEHHVPLGQESEAVVIEMLRLARDRIVRAREEGGTQYLQVVQNWGKQAGAMTNHLCFDVYDLPHLPHRIGNRARLLLDDLVSDPQRRRGRFFRAGRMGQVRDNQRQCLGCGKVSQHGQNEPSFLVSLGGSKRFFAHLQLLLRGKAHLLRNADGTA